MKPITEHIVDLVRARGAMGIEEYKKPLDDAGFDILRAHDEKMQEQVDALQYSELTRRLLVDLLAERDRLRALAAAWPKLAEQAGERDGLVVRVAELQDWVPPDRFDSMRAERDRWCARVQRAFADRDALQVEYHEYVATMRAALEIAGCALDASVCEVTNKRAEKAEAELQRLREVCQSAHDRLLHGDSDSDLLAILSSAWADQSQSDGVSPLSA